jgi:hypothetical protein
MNAITKVHFISDSPSGQYRNRTNAFLLSLIHNRGFTGATWNFCECGHGKGAPDGVGAAVKRRADKCVADGTANVLCAADLVALINNAVDSSVMAWEVRSSIGRE